MDGEEQQNPMVFRILQSSLAEGASARLGRLIIPGRKEIETPSFFATTSRGAVPHLTSDNVSRYRPFQGAVVGLEDFVEKYQKELKASPAIHDIPVPSKGGSRLQAFTTMPSDIVSVLAPRRFPAGASHLPNGTNHISMFTANGFDPLTTSAYSAAIESLRPDIAIAMADLTYGDTDRTPSSKRAARMADRTEDWVAKAFNDMTPTMREGTAAFAPTLPLPYPMQWTYLNRLSELQEANLNIAGLAVYDVAVLPDIEANHASLAQLPRLSLDSSNSRTPHQILRQVSLGADIIVLPGANTASDAGLAFTFTFPPPLPQSTNTTLLPLAIDLSLPEHSTSLAPLSQDCTCYTCTFHHRAYITHLLDAREMLAWTLLQIHNYHVLTGFFATIRAALAEGTFQEASRRFALVYESEFPEGTATKPRARGYHFASVGGDERRNKPAFVAKPGSGMVKGGNGEQMIVVDDEAGTETPVVDTRSGVETPLVPEGDAADLKRKGFAEVLGEAGEEEKAEAG